MEEGYFQLWRLNLGERVYLVRHYSIREPAYRNARTLSLTDLDPQHTYEVRTKYGLSCVVYSQGRAV